VYANIPFQESARMSRMHEGVTTTLIVIGQGDKLTFVALSLSAELCDTCLATVSVMSFVVTDCGDEKCATSGHTPKMHTKNLSMLLVVGGHGVSVYEQDFSAPQGDGSQGRP
jgi:hypothetical protein